MMKYFIGIDNGVTGSICVLDADGNCLLYIPTPVVKCLNYTKAKEMINRVVVRDLADALQPYAKTATVLLERPLVNPGRWKATVSAIRCDEATRGVLEALKAKLIYVDSREWQTSMLPKRPAPPRPAPRLKKNATDVEIAINTDAKKARKKAMTVYTKEGKDLSLLTAQRLFPTVTFKGDGDAALIAEWARKENL